MINAAEKRATFSIALYHGIWRVTLDGVFFGDYRSKLNALDGLRDKSRALEKTGALVNVVVATGAA